jgi:predicted secreted protein
MKKFGIMTGALLCTILAAGLAWPGMTVLKMSDNCKEIRVQAGEVIELALEEQGGTGYTWEFDRLDKKHFQVMRTETRPLAAPPLVGGPVLKVWQLQTKTPGKAKLSLDYLRPWEGRAKAVKHFEVEVHIR